jgi:AraC-like DNA-binding protein
MLVQLFELNKAAAPLYELTTKGLLQLIVAKLLQLGGTAARARLPSAERMKIERLKMLIDYIQANFARPLRLQDLAAHVAISEAYLCRFFKEFTRQSPLSYVGRIRVQKAAVLLRDTDAKIMDIALDVGFANLSYFVVVFKQHFGCTPSEYRKRG